MRGVYYPFRELIVALGGEADWDADTNEAIAVLPYEETEDGGIIYDVAYFEIGKNYYVNMTFLIYDDEEPELLIEPTIYEMDAESFIQDGKTYLPIKYVCEFFDYTATYDEKSNTITIE